MKRLVLPLALAAAFAHADTVVFQDDFEKDLSQWVGQNGDGTVPMHVTQIEDPKKPGNKVLRFDKKVFGGDAFSKTQFPKGAYTLEFDYLGTCKFNCGGVIGYTAEFPGRDNWLAGTAGGFPDKLKDTGEWKHYSLDFKGKFDFHLAMEQWTNSDGDGGDVYVDNIKLISHDAAGAAPAAAAAAAPAVITGGVPAPTSPQYVGYYVAWAPGKGYPVRTLETSGAAGQLTVINYAFGNVVNNQCVVGDADLDYKNGVKGDQAVNGKTDEAGALAGNWGQLLQLKQKHPNLKVVISLGGWTWSKNFSDAALPANREAFVKSCVDTFIKGNVPGAKPGLAAGVFDGIDIDWEYPGTPGNEGNVVRAEDKDNYVALLNEFRKQLDALKPGYLLTVAASASGQVYNNLDLGRVQLPLNWINLMTYDFAGPWESRTSPHANLLAGKQDKLSVDIAVSDYLEKGVAPAKLVIGVPFYGYGWVPEKMDNHGLYQAVKAKAKGTPDAGTASYAQLKAMGGDVFRDDVTKSIAKVNGGEVWVYDDVGVIKDKAAYIKSKKLGGMMVWEMSQDTPDGELSTAIYNNLLKK